MLKSKAQERFLWAKKPKLAQEFEDKTPSDAKLPEHVKKMAEGGKVLSDEENKKLSDYLLRQTKGNVAEYEKDPHPSAGVIRSIRSKTLVPKGGEIDKELKPETEMKDAGISVKEPQLMASGGFVGSTLPDLMDKLTPGASSSALLGGTTAIQSPTPPQSETEALTEEESQNKEKIKDSTPGHTAQDLSGVIQGYENQASKYGPEQEQAVLDQILKERGGVGRNIGRGIAAFTDTAGPAFGAGTGTLKSLDERENEMEKARLESVPTLQGMNEKQLAQKMALEQMNPSSPMAQAKAQAYQTVFKQLFPNMDQKTLTSLTANPSIAEKIFPEIGPIVEKQIQLQLQKEGLNVQERRAMAEEANQMTGRKMEEQKMGIEHPILKALGKLPSVLPEGTTSQEGRISVISPTGVAGHIPASQLKAALAKGYKQQ